MHLHICVCSLTYQLLVHSCLIRMCIYVDFNGVYKACMSTNTYTYMCVHVYVRVVFLKCWGLEAQTGWKTLTALGLKSRCDSADNREISCKLPQSLAIDQHFRGSLSLLLGKHWSSVELPIIQTSQAEASARITGKKPWRLRALLVRQLLRADMHELAVLSAAAWLSAAAVVHVLAY